ncbi:hypothetical protein SprV_0200784900 [Sparganum proliferum]
MSAVGHQRPTDETAPASPETAIRHHHHRLRLINDELKIRFYEDKHVLLASVPMANKLVVLDEFTARVGATSLPGGER